MRNVLAASLLLSALCACAKVSNSQSSSSAAPADSANGAGIYIANCASCHQPNGRGLTGTFPPLAGSQIVNGDPARVIRIVKYGTTGRLEVAGRVYEGMMPAWSPTLPDDAIAATISYIRSSWGNHGSPLTPAQVSAVSK